MIAAMPHLSQQSISPGNIELSWNPPGGPPDTHLWRKARIDAKLRDETRDPRDPLVRATGPASPLNVPVNPAASVDSCCPFQSKWAG